MLTVRFVIFAMLPGLAVLPSCRFGFGGDGDEGEARDRGYLGPGDFPDEYESGDSDEPDASPDADVDAGGEPIVVPPLEDGGSDNEPPPEPDAGSGEPDAGVITPPVSTTVLFSGNNRTGQRGGTGGSGFSETCPASHVIAGYQGYVSSDPSRSWVMRMQALCAPVSIEGALATGVTLGKPIALLQHGTDGNVAWKRVCPANQQVVGFTGRFGAYLDEIVLSCAPITVSGSPGSYTLGLGSTVTLAPVGGGGGSAFAPAMCPSGQVAYGHEGRSGQWMDALGLVCGVPQGE